MSNDSFSEVTTESWFSRIGQSIKGILFGFVLFLGAFPLLWWNEGRSVERYNSLQEGLAAVVSVASDTVDPANQGKLVYTHGFANTDETLRDEPFGVSTKALKLTRKVEMYQWQEQVKTETKEEVGGSKTTKKTYSYNKVWSDNAIDSATFKQATDHSNPPLPVANADWQAQNVTLGAFKLNQSQISRIAGGETLLTDNARLPSQLADKTLSSTAEGLYIGSNQADPQIGDLKVSFQIVKPTDISLVAEQLGSGFTPYQTQAGSPIDLLETGVVDASAMFAAAQRENTIMTWAIRLGGCFAMWLGLSMIFRPLAVLGSVLPFLGSLISMGTGILAFLITLPCSGLTIAIAWIAYRPVLAGILIGISVLSIVAMKFMPRRAPIPAQGLKSA